MPRTVAEGFVQFRSNLEITDLQEATASERQTRIREVLEGHLHVLDTFLAGSYRRNTLIGPLAEADIDVFVVLGSRYYAPAGQQQLLERVRAALRKTYPRTARIRPDGQAVTVKFADFKMDVVPGFRRKGGGFLIPDADTRSWISTDHKEHVEIWAEANRAHDGKLVPLIKMMKAWNRPRKVLRSFHLETLTLIALQDVTISNMPSGVRYVFDKARAAIRATLPDPGGYNTDVGAYLDTVAKMDRAIERVEWAFRQACAAERLDVRGDVPEAFRRWRLIFPDHFPAYG
jgi:hypothetical protein